jgi:hypothetical protein
MAAYSIGDFVILGTMIAQISEVKEEGGQVHYRLSVSIQNEDWIPEADLAGKKLTVS